MYHCSLATSLSFIASDYWALPTLDEKCEWRDANREGRQKDRGPETKSVSSSNEWDKSVIVMSLLVNAVQRMP
jgi:hypothetical protein